MTYLPPTSTITCYNRVGLRETWPSPCSIWWCCVTTVWVYKGFSMEKNGNRCLVVFSSVISPLSLIRSHLSFGVPLLRKSTHTWFWTDPAQSQKTPLIPPTPQIPMQNNCTRLSCPFQLTSKPNLSPQRTLQSSESKNASHLELELILPGPAVDTCEAWAKCRANKLTLTRGRERRVLGEYLQWLAENSALPSPGQGQFVNPSFRLGSGGEGGSPLNGLYRYVLQDRVWFLEVLNP